MATVREHEDQRPVLLVDVDGVIALFGFPPHQPPPDTAWQMIEGFGYFLSRGVAPLLSELAEHFELVWCTGWEDRANDYLPRLLGTPGPLPVIRFARNPGRANAHWKLDEVTEHVGSTRPVAWIDDALDENCDRWASERTAAGGPTLLVRTEPSVGMLREHADELIAFARSSAS